MEKNFSISQMEPSINLETTYYIKGENFLLKVSGSIEKFKGFKSLQFSGKR